MRDQILGRVKKNFSGRAPRVAFPEMNEERVVEASHFLLKEKVCEEIFSLEAEKKLSGRDHSFLNFSLMKSDLEERVFESLRKSVKRKGKKVEEKELLKKASSPLYKGVYLLEERKLDAVVAGCAYTTKDVIRAGLDLLEREEGVSTVSSSFLMARETEGERPPFLALYADCGVLIQPSVEEMVDLAESTLNSWKNFSFLFGEQEACVAFLSYATHDSAWDESVERVKKAKELFSKRQPSVLCDGPLQFDAAYDLSVRRRKVENSSLGEETANIFIFPDLNSGNIAYKMSQRLGNCQAFGPLLQGFNRAYSDLSRGASPEDIALTTCLKLLSLSP